MESEKSVVETTSESAGSAPRESKLRTAPARACTTSSPTGGRSSATRRASTPWRRASTPTRWPRRATGPIESLLELGSVGDNNALHMKRRFPRRVLTDLRPACSSRAAPSTPSASTGSATCARCAWAGRSTRCSSTTRSAT